jgi:hypothetical protein
MCFSAHVRSDGLRLSARHVIGCHWNPVIRQTGTAQDGIDRQRLLSADRPRLPAVTGS